MRHESMHEIKGMRHESRYDVEGRRKELEGMRHK